MFLPMYNDAKRPTNNIETGTAKMLNNRISSVRISAFALAIIALPMTVFSQALDKNPQDYWLSAKQVGDEMPTKLSSAIKRVTEQGIHSSATRPLYNDQSKAYDLEQIDVARNLSYGAHERHVLDVHTHKSRSLDTLMPVIVYFHGGGFVRGDKDGNRNVSDYFASLGLVGVNATYRLAPEAKWPDGANDMGAAVAWIKTYVFRPDVLNTGIPAAAGVIMVSGTYGADTANPGENRIAYFGGDLSRWPEISTIGNVSRVDIPVMMTISEFDNEASQASMAALVGEYTEKSGQLPRVVQLMGHNHYSPNPSIGTQDTQLSAAILQFVHSVVGNQALLTAR
jgi:hypothetical protein